MASRVQEQPIVQWMSQRARRWFFSIGLVSMALVCGLSSAANISYVYDSLGRVIAVIDPATDTAVYSYDAVGTLTGITRQTSATKSILQFTPSSGVYHFNTYRSSSPLFVRSNRSLTGSAES